MRGAETRTHEREWRIVVQHSGQAGEILRVVRQRFADAKRGGIHTVIVAHTYEPFAARLAASVDEMLIGAAREERATVQRWDPRSDIWVDDRPRTGDEAQLTVEGSGPREIDTWFEAATGAERRIAITIQERDRPTLLDGLRTRLPLRADLVNAKGTGQIVVFVPKSAVPRILDTIRGAVRAIGCNAALAVDRWNAETEEWEDDKLPDHDHSQTPELPHPDACRWEVAINHAWWECTGLEGEARRAGFLALAARPGLLIAVRDDDERAAALAWIGKRLPFAVPEVRRIGRFRHWQWRESLFGNYSGVKSPEMPFG